MTKKIEMMVKTQNGDYKIRSEANFIAATVILSGSCDDIFT